jgi:hypothetical protein
MSAGICPVDEMFLELVLLQKMTVCQRAKKETAERKKKRETPTKLIEIKTIKTGR